MEEQEKAELSLYRRILSWNFYALWEKTESGQTSNFFGNLKELPHTFSDAEDYISAFEPLMLEECAAVMLRGLEEAEVLQPQKCITGPTEEVGDFLVVQFLLEMSCARKFGYNDVVLLTSENPNEVESNEGLNALGMMESRINEKSMQLRFFLSGNTFAEQHKERQRVEAVAARLRQASSGWWLTKVTGLSTFIREWDALHAITKVNFRQPLFTAKPNDLAGAAVLKVPEAMEEAMGRQYNKSQMKALTGGLRGQQMVLIQGPPGTGKTKTLLGLLSVILYALPKGSMGLRKNRTTLTQNLTTEEKTCIWLSSLLRPNPRDLVKPWEEGSPTDDFGMARVQKPYQVGIHNKPTAHVLVCAPSNSALDEIVLRLLGGILDRKGKIFKPNIVRVGLSVHHSVQSVALDTLVEKRLAQLAPTKAAEEREKTKLELIESAHIVCSTLSFSGSSLLRQLSKPFDVVVIDEAAQAVEPSTLIPLCTGAKQVYLIGDPVQLPATVISRGAIKYKYDMSMFKRLQSAGYPVNMLDTQYRMHPSISAYPSKEFYQGNLRDGPDVAAVTRRPWHTSKCLGPFAFYDVRGEESVPEGSSSLENSVEAEIIVRLYTAMANAYPQLLNNTSVAVVSPYLAQVQLLRRQFTMFLGAEKCKYLDINTIDGFQGREKEVVFFSAVRSTKTGHVGFVADERRINVGLTRARSSLLVVGNASALQQSVRWRSLLRHARHNGCFYQPTLPYADFFPRAIAGTVEPEGLNAEDLQELRGRTVVDEDDMYSDDEFAAVLNPAITAAKEKPPPKKQQSHKRPSQQPASVRPAKKARQE